MKRIEITHETIRDHFHHSGTQQWPEGMEWGDGIVLYRMGNGLIELEMPVDLSGYLYSVGHMKRLGTGARAHYFELAQGDNLETVERKLAEARTRKKRIVARGSEAEKIIRWLESGRTEMVRYKELDMQVPHERSNRKQNWE